MSIARHTGVCSLSLAYPAPVRAHAGRRSVAEGHAYAPTAATRGSPVQGWGDCMQGAISLDMRLDVSIVAARQRTQSSPGTRLHGREGETMQQHRINHQQGSTGRPEIPTVRRLHTVTLVVLLGLLVLGVLAEAAYAIEVPLPTKEQMVYGDFPVVGRRIAVWAIAQLHLMFGAFVVGVPLFILIIEIIGAATKSE